MTRPPALPDAQKLYEVCEATWPPATVRTFDAWTIREGRGGGQRVSAATENWPATEADLPPAEAAMTALGQDPVFQVREGETALDSLLHLHGYEVVDPVNLWALPVADVAQPGTRPPSGTVFTIWPPLEIMRELWAQGGIGAGRLSVMDRAPAPKTALLTRAGDHPGGVGFVGIHDGYAMVHALYVPESQRRQGAARAMLHEAAFWAQAQGATWLTLIVTQGNHAANPLYASLGMHLVGHYHYRRKPLTEGPK